MDLDIKCAPQQAELDNDEALERKDVRELEQSIQHLTYEVGPNADVLGPTCVFKNKITDASRALSAEFRDLGIAEPEWDALSQRISEVGECLRGIGSQTVDVVSFERGGETVKIAATPPGVEFATERVASAVISQYSKALSACQTPDESREVQKMVVRSLFPDVQYTDQGMATSRLGFFKIRPPVGTGAGLGRVVGIGVAGTGTLLANVCCQ